MQLCYLYDQEQYHSIPYNTILLQVLQIIPESMFEILAKIIEIQVSLISAILVASP